MDLFLHDSGLLRLVDDAESGVRYWPRAVDAQTAETWFDALRRGARWQTQARPMYDRIVAVPRLLAAYRVDALPADLPLAAMLALVQRLAPAPYTGAGLNLYRDGQDSVAMHRDTLRTLASGQPLALVSLGAPRRMLLRAQQDGAKSIAVDLAPGSVLVMSHASQLTHLHGIPKTTRPVGPRISVVFRVRAPAALDEDREDAP
ncbi:alpha-ketoglutarate-dependent dioxygenase AlkB [Luteimonas deserti]|uniref:Alpha-ketoglutarate-dependent dioxygenase AlkB n=1 Tax=Luteimonas deserti TaxID=2752306 RepID=A0A7Z0TZX8_9GAMM|nr:alpha-ketoglutarate-dependent dioxygenase AlkB [Luteimonas deserti]NYZ63877.1 alpha-ketoglutarate-dependent dioxygenase AlkB [Luteimonas deserti]